MSKVYAAGDEPAPGYRLTRFLGRGGSGEVWEVTAPGGARSAVKIIRLDGRQSRKEFRAIQMVKRVVHPHLVPIIALFLKDNQGQFLRDELMDASALNGTISISIEDIRQAERFRANELLIVMGLGDKTLRKRLEESQAQQLAGIPPHELVRYIEDAARGIDHLNSPNHDLGEGRVSIQHRNIKPENIILIGDSAQVSDFGLARVLNDTHMSIGTGAVLSPAYLPPETLRGGAPSAKGDQFSLAMSYFELRTGHLPFPPNASLMDMINAHLNSKLDFTDLTAGERTVIQKATAREPMQRFDNCLQFVKALRRAVERELGDAPILMPAPSGGVRLPKPATEPTPARTAAIPTSSTATAATRIESAAPPPSSVSIIHEANLMEVLPGAVEFARPGAARSFWQRTLMYFLGKGGKQALECSVFGPPAIAPGDAALLEVGLQHFKPQHDLRSSRYSLTASGFLVPTQRKLGQRLGLNLYHGGTLTFHLSVPGLRIDDPTRQLVWRGQPESVTFPVEVPDRHGNKPVIGTIRILWENGIPIGHTHIRLNIDSRVSEAGASKRADLCLLSRQYQLAYPSFASQDRAAVQERLRILARSGVRWAAEMLTVDPGMRWDRKLYTQIDQADVFLLFWSNAARQSEIVQRELDYALRKQRGSEQQGLEIIPIILQGPPIPHPPKILEHLRFTEFLSYLKPALY